MRAGLVSKKFRLACAGVIAIALVAFAVARLVTAPTRPSLAASVPAPKQRPAGAAGDFMLIDSTRLELLPTSGAAYAYMKRTAGEAMEMMDLTSPTSTSPWLPNYGAAGSATLAAALVYARTGDARYRDFVVRVNRFVIGSEDSASTNGTTADDKLLATMRQIGAYVMAADLVGMDRDVTGSRSGYGSTVWKTWLGALRTKSIGSGNCSSIVDCNLKATNWGAWASASRTAIDIYLDDTADLSVAVDRLKLYLGEPARGAEWVKSGSYDPSWACASSSQFTPVNGSSCGSDKDGVIVEDASRSAASYPSWDDTGIDYSFHAYGAQLIAAVLLERRGYDVWSWGDRALKRIMDRLDRLGVATGNGRSSATHVSWIPRYFYGTDYPTVPAQIGNTLGYTDWLYGPAAIGFGKLTRNTRQGTAVAVVRVPGPGKLVLAGEGLRKVTRTTLRPGPVRLSIRPADELRDRLDRSGRVSLRVRLRFSPPVGAAKTHLKTIELRRQRR